MSDTEDSIVTPMVPIEKPLTAIDAAGLTVAPPPDKVAEPTLHVLETEKAHGTVHGGEGESALPEDVKARIIYLINLFSGVFFIVVELLLIRADRKRPWRMPRTTGCMTLSTQEIGSRARSGSWSASCVLSALNPLQKQRDGLHLCRFPSTLLLHHWDPP